MTKAELMAKVTTAMVSKGAALMAAKAAVQTIEPVVTAYQKEVLSRNQWTNKGEVERHLLRLATKGADIDIHVEERVITDPRHTYQLSDQDFDCYLLQVRVEQEKAGLKTESPEHCPLLVAEEVERKACREFLESMSPITQMSFDDVICARNGLELVRKLEDLCLGLLGSLGYFADLSGDRLFTKAS